MTLLFVVGCSADDQSPDNNDHHHDEDVGAHSHDAGEHSEQDGGNSDDGDAAHEESDVAVDAGSNVTITPEAKSYCECMLVNCHDPFHDRWGSDDPEAISNCEVEASQLPSEGVEVMSGPSIECRQYHCDQAADGEDSCPSALGGGECQ